MARLGLLPLLLFLTAQCGAATSTPSAAQVRPHIIVRSRAPKHFSLRPGEQRVFAPGALLPGDAVTCRVSGRTLRLRVRNHPGAVWSAGTGNATPSGTGGQLQVETRPDGSATARCSSGASQSSSS